METVFASDLELEGELCTLASSMQLLAMCGRPPGGRPEGEGGGGKAGGRRMGKANYPISEIFLEFYQTQGKPLQCSAVIDVET